MKATKRLSQAQRRRHSQRRHDDNHMIYERDKRGQTPRRNHVLERKVEMRQRDYMQNVSGYDFKLPYRAPGRGQQRQIMEFFKKLLGNQSTDDLRKRAAEHDIKGRSRMNKAQLIEALTEVEGNK